MANLDRIRGVVALIEEDFEKYNGKHFNMEEFVGPPPAADLPAFCNTTMCFAGWAMVHQDGMVPFLERAVSKVITPFSEDERWEATSWANGQIEKDACAYLEITRTQGELIFYRTAIETVEELKHRITDVVGETIWEGVDPQPVYQSVYNRSAQW